MAEQSTMYPGDDMDLEFGDEESELRDNVRSVLSGSCPPRVVRSLYDDEVYPVAVWEKMVELYWPALAVPEVDGGLGLGFVQLAIVSEEIGRALVASPWLATATQFAPMIGELGSPEQRSRFLSPLAAGKLTGTLALAERARWRLGDISAVATPAAGGRWTLNGVKEAVFDGAAADEFVVIARAGDGYGAFVVPQADVVARPRAVIDPTWPIADVELIDVEVPSDRVLGQPGSDFVRHGVERALQAATVAVATATVGTSRVIFEHTVEYAKVREQYGKPIGSFQALKHRLADMYLSIERATALCYFAALTIAEDDDRRAVAASLAKAAAGECQRLVVGDGLQLHGGIGYTWENDLHFWLKRAKAGDAMFGNAFTHRGLLAGLIGLAPATAQEAAA
jgi:alkylation response protein AidB-like acyl-CoA dehydrogenase